MSDYNNIQKNIWRSLTSEGVKLPHALLFAGPKGVGKREVADTLATRLMCEATPAPYQTACGRCLSCIMMASGTHPDYRLVQPEAAEAQEVGGGETAGETAAVEGEKKKGSKQIRIQQIRELEAFFHIGGHRGGARVCLIEPAEAMNNITANSLLKILEEPSDAFYFMMISNHWNTLLPTLLSRSRRVMFSPPSAAEGQAWLSQKKMATEARWLPFFGHAPLALVDAVQSGRLKAIETVVADLMKPQEPLAQAARWESHVKSDGVLDMEVLVTTVQKWLFDLGLVAVGSAPRYLPQQNKALATIAQRLSLPALLQAQKQLLQLRRWANHPLNARLFLEDLCVRAFRPLG